MKIRYAYTGKPVPRFLPTAVYEGWLDAKARFPFAANLYRWRVDFYAEANDPHYARLTSPNGYRRVKRVLWWIGWIAAFLCGKTRRRKS